MVEEGAHNVCERSDRTIWYVHERPARDRTCVFGKHISPVAAIACQVELLGWEAI